MADSDSKNSDAGKLGNSAELPPQQAAPVIAEPWCFAWLVAPTNPSGAERAGLVRASAWPQGGHDITISFLGGDERIQKQVKEIALQWTAYKVANLNFAFREGTNNTDVRISFRAGGSWSAIGTTCRKFSDMSRPTMNLALSADMPCDIIRRTVLHEFGHVLGFIHEHSHPAAPIAWNRELVIAELQGPPNHWSEDTINKNVFEPVAAGEINGVSFDKDSIMLYPIPARWTDGRFSSAWNTQLSIGDRELAHTQYP